MARAIWTRRCSGRRLVSPRSRLAFDSHELARSTVRRISTVARGDIAGVAAGARAQPVPCLPTSVATRISAPARTVPVPACLRSLDGHVDRPATTAMPDSRRHVGACAPRGSSCCRKSSMS